jgi:hypothetical protein
MHLPDQAFWAVSSSKSSTGFLAVAPVYTRFRKGTLEYYGVRIDDPLRSRRTFIRQPGRASRNRRIRTGAK